MITFALLGHPAHYDHVADLLLRMRPSLGPERVHSHKTSLGKVFEWSSSFATNEELIAPRPDGTHASGKLIVCTFLPERAHTPRQLSAAYQKTRDGVRLAKELGAKIVGLGGFTSIVGGAQGERLPHEFGLAVTSGNSLTAALAVEQIKMLFAKLQRPLAGQTVAVLGATGDIGRACALALAAERVGSLMLIARNKAKLTGLRDEIKTHHNFPGDVHIAADPTAARQATLIIAATSAAQPLLAEAELKPGTVVCDIGYPHTLAHAPEPRPDALIFQGGLAQAPFALDITHYTLLPSPSILYGCFAETIALAMAGRYESYSQGQGRITLERMGAILDLARSLGFGPSPLYRGGKPIAEESIEAFAHFPERE